MGDLNVLHSDGTLVAAAGASVSGWQDVSNFDVITISRTAAGGVYAFEIEWSRNRSVVDVTEVVTVGNNGRVDIKPAAPFARFRVRNTDAVTAFTAHRTNVVAKEGG